MGQSKQLFMDDREEEFYSVPNQLKSYPEAEFYSVTEKSNFNPFEQIADTFLTQAEDYEAGNIDALETAILMRKDYERLEIQMNLRKTWIDENKEEIENEAAKYPEGHKGYKVIMQTRATLNFKSIPQWIALENAKKEFEAKSKAAFNLVKKGGLNVDESGEEIPLPEESVSSFIKFDKVK